MKTTITPVLLVLCLSLSSAWAMDDYSGRDFRGDHCGPFLTGGRAVVKVGAVADRLWRLDVLKKYPDLEKAYLKNSRAPIWPLWSQGLQKLAAIKDVIAHLPSDEQTLYRETYAMIEAALTKHTLVFVNARDPGDFKIEAHIEVLRKIADFDVTQARLGFFQVRRSIKKLFSKTEYLNCR